MCRWRRSRARAIKGRITQDDVAAFTRQVMGRCAADPGAGQPQGAPCGGWLRGLGLDLLPWPKVDFAKFGAVERKELSRIKKISGANLTATG